MGLLQLLCLAVGLSMDACAAAICKGLSLGTARVGDALTVGLYFGTFQAVMPLAGYCLGDAFAGAISRFDHWVVFFLLAAIGISMIVESRSKETCYNSSLRPCAMVALALATSVDALAVGITFSVLQVPPLSASAAIGLTTFALSVFGVYLGQLFGLRYKAKAQLLGGAVLLLMGTHLLLEHLDLLP